MSLLHFNILITVYSNQHSKRVEQFANYPAFFSRFKVKVCIEYDKKCLCVADHEEPRAARAAPAPRRAALPRKHAGPVEGSNF